jgi:hypothetical protein
MLKFCLTSFLRSCSVAAAAADSDVSSCSRLRHAAAAMMCARDGNSGAIEPSLSLQVMRCGGWINDLGFWFACGFLAA